MEFATTKPSKPSSNISEIVSKFAKVCKLRSIGVFSAENPLNANKNDLALGGDSSDNTEETEYGEKVHPQPFDGSRERNVCFDEEILQLFDVVSALKLAYVQFQEAHIPYDPEKIIAADKLIISKFDVLCKVKRAYKEKQFKTAKQKASQLDRLRSEIGVIERLLEKLKSQNRTKDAEITNLRQQLQDLAVGNAKLVEMIRRENLERQSAKVLDIYMFQYSFRAASKSIHDFAKPLINLMKASGWDLDQAADSIEDGVVYSRRAHKKYAFEAYIVRRMFHGMSLKSFKVDDILRLNDPIDALIENPNSAFAKFCGKKYLQVVHPAMEASFFGNLDQRMFVSSGKHPRTPFYQIFVKMAKWIWVLQGIAASIDPEAKIFTVKRGSRFSDVYMEAIEKDAGGMAVPNEGQSAPKVEFMVMPGFRIGEAVVRSRVYLSLGDELH